MNLQEVLSQIRQEQGDFSAAQRLVAAYVVENYHQIPFLTITSLAKNIGVSDNTIVKFCNHLGYDKFTEFKKVFSDYAHSELVMFNKLSESDSGQEDEARFFALEMEEDISAIQATLSDPVNRENLPKLLSMMAKAKHIYITGGRASGIMAEFFVNTLRYLNLKVYGITFGVCDYLDQMSVVDKEDLVIAITFPRYTAQVIDALRDLHEAGVPVALITDTGLSPAYPYADLAFHCVSTTSSYTLCYSGCLALINTICRAAGVTRKKEASQHIRRLESHLLERGVFL
ncbi:MAG: MurR/RpiR family transcriptional regulator [Lawsonibacter sp.]|nr:MurR/RpiR family transcriptional regulator [Lawsonibacter sp.]